MAVERHWLDRFANGGATEAAGMGQLQADQQIIRVPKMAGMFAQQRLAQLDQPRQGCFAGHQLVGISPAILAHSHRLATPNQFSTALPKTLPTPQR